MFSRDILDKPLVLILDEFHALNENVLNGLVGIFRNIYNRRKSEMNKPTDQRRYLLHAVALIGVRSVLGVENKTGSPFNVQQSLHIPNLTYDEVTTLFQWYEKESKRTVSKEVIHRLYSETRGQPGLTCYFSSKPSTKRAAPVMKPCTTTNPST